MTYTEEQMNAAMLAAYNQGHSHGADGVLLGLKTVALRCPAMPACEVLRITTKAFSASGYLEPLNKEVLEPHQ